MFKHYLVGVLGCVLMLLGGMALPFLPAPPSRGWEAALAAILAGFLMYAWGVLSDRHEQE